MTGRLSARRQLAPESGTFYDFMYEKRDTGRWVRWIDTIDKNLSAIPENAKVGRQNAQAGLINVKVCPDKKRSLPIKARTDLEK